MQNVVNYRCPFFKDRKPIVGGRVYFVKPSTTAQTFNSVSGLDYADYIAVKDKNGTLLENPLSLNDEGCFETQPFVEDGVEFKMIVCYPTEQPARLNDETPCWEVAYTIDSKTQTVEVHYDDVACVDSIYDLAQLQPSVGRAIVLGYASKNDFCPPRFFEWVTGESDYNRGTVLRSVVSNTGAWVCVPSGFVDVRWFGVDPSSQTDYTSVLSEIAQACANVPVYFPTGNYYLSNHVIFQNAIAEKLVDFYPEGDVTNDLKFEVVNRFEDRGAHFMGNSNACVIYPKVKGQLRTSCISSLANAALSATALTGIDEIVFDSNVSLESGSTVTISHKKVLVKYGRIIPSGITFDDTCHVYYETDGKTCAGSLKLGNDWLIEPDESQTVPEFKISKGVNLLAKLKTTLIEFFIKVKLAVGFLIDSDNAWEYMDDSQSDWNGFLVLKARRVKAVDVRADSLVVYDGIVNKSFRFNDKFIAEVSSSYITYLDSHPYVQEEVSNNVVFLEQIHDYESWDVADGDIINVIINNENNMTICLPNRALNCSFVIYMPLRNDNYGKQFVEVSDLSTSDNVVVLSIVKVLGRVPLNTLTQNVVRVVIRPPTNEERTRCNIHHTDHWIIDPLTT